MGAWVGGGADEDTDRKILRSQRLLVYRKHLIVRNKSVISLRESSCQCRDVL